MDISYEEIEITTGSTATIKNNETSHTIPDTAKINLDEFISKLQITGNRGISLLYAKFPSLYNFILTFPINQIK